MIHPDTELRFVSPTVGWGVFATRAIPRGTIVWALDELDQRLDRTSISAMPPLLRRMLERYSYEDNRGFTVLCWDHGRYVNHSCDPTLLAPGWDFEIAVRDLVTGDEVTDDYTTLGGGDDFLCQCGAASCRGRVSAQDFEKLADGWDAKLASAFRNFRAVQQPLWPLIRAAERDEVEAVLSGKRAIPSIRGHAPSA